MDKVASQIDGSSAVYETIAIQFDPNYERIIKAIDIVKKFIRERKLVIYGGMAIDYALRLKGKQLYSDEQLAIMDFDMFSSDSVQDAYDLCDIFYKTGFTEARTINGMHKTTIRVDIVNKNFIADMSYVPPNVFKKIPTLEYDGMTFVHPYFQYIDQMQAISFPYQDSPFEVIFHRLKKDVERFNLLEKYYPLEEAIVDSKSKPIKLETVEFKHGILSEVFTGFAAYSILYTEFQKCTKEYGKLNAMKTRKDTGILPAVFEITNSGVKFSLVDKLEIISNKPLDTIAELKIHDTKLYARYMDVIEEHTTGKLGQYPVVVYSTEHKLLCVSKYDNVKRKIKTCGAAFLLKYFFSRAFTESNPAYYKYYLSVKRMINIMEDVFKELEDTKSIEHEVLESPFMLTYKVYGSDNISDAQEFMYNMVRRDLHMPDVVYYSIPSHYHPAKGGPQPTFNYEGSPLFTYSGEELEG